jgi:hypothetical protein
MEIEKVFFIFWHIIQNIVCFFPPNVAGSLDSLELSNGMRQNYSAVNHDVKLFCNFDSTKKHSEATSDLLLTTNS